jgi:hypothetical protein
VKSFKLLEDGKNHDLSLLLKNKERENITCFSPINFIRKEGKKCGKDTSIA